MRIVDAVRSAILAGDDESWLYHLQDSDLARDAHFDNLPFSPDFRDFTRMQLCETTRHRRFWQAH